MMIKDVYSVLCLWIMYTRTTESTFSKQTQVISEGKKKNFFSGGDKGMEKKKGVWGKGSEDIC